MMKKLWGDHFYVSRLARLGAVVQFGLAQDPVRREWTDQAASADGRPLIRGFVSLVLTPLQRLFRALQREGPDVWKVPRSLAYAYSS